MGLLKWTLVAGLAALFGFGGIAAGAADIAKVLFFVLLVICVVLAVAGIFSYKAVT